ncbi:GTP-binding protein [Paenibacillus sp. NPDC058071]|uniref:GTP-binding protein n=1 Tax=Paenibacillus sp. NPDC058071 TaxID=3346326 RepID=UPI0036DDFDFD
MMGHAPITVGLLAHVDAGKTTFAEQLLYRANSIRNRGRVDHKDAFLDIHDLEKARGITIFADQASMLINNRTYDLIDTPGHVDFSAEMERSLQAMDYAVVIISAAEGIEGHTETVWELLKKHCIPVFFFINKTDREGADADAVLAQIRKQLSPDAVPAGGTGYPDELLSAAAERDEELLEAYLDGKADETLARLTISRLIKERQLFPVMSGSALLDVGIAESMERLTEWTYASRDQGAPFAARVYKIRHDKQGTRVTFMKATQGTLRVRDEIVYEDRNGEQRRDKVTSIRLYSGDKYTSADQAEAGKLFAVTGLTSAEAGFAVGEGGVHAQYELMPVLQSKVLYDRSIPDREALRRFQLLDAEDPSLAVSWNEALQELHVHVMGTIQLEVLEQVLADRFDMAVSFGTPEVLYKETIDNSVFGYGHFEPLGHLAEVHLLLEPGPRGGGLTFMNRCHPNDLASGFQNAIGQYLTEKDHHGLLTGSPVTDLKVTLLTGKSHNMHTSGGDFREAALRALRQGLEKADNVLLEPVYAVKIKASLDHIGKIMSDIQQASGVFDPPETDGDQTMITAAVPVSTFLNYGLEFAAFTRGKGSLSLRPGGYKRCHQTDKVIADKGYNKDADPEYTSTSIFCAKGKGFSIPWQEVESYLSIKV